MTWIDALITMLAGYYICRALRRYQDRPRKDPTPRRANCDWVFISGHPLLAICPHCGGFGELHRKAKSGEVYPDAVAGVDWLTPALEEIRKRDNSP